MNGSRYLLDTNAIIALLQGSEELSQTLTDAHWIGVSVISVIEFLAYPDLTQEDAELLSEFLSRVSVVSLQYTDSALVQTTIRLRKLHGVQLPDAMIAATAIVNDAILVTSDQSLLRIPSIRTNQFNAV